MGSVVNRGEIWNFRFDRPDKQRPVLILTRQEMIDTLHTVTVAPLTGTIRGVPSEVVIGTETGLKKPSAINLHHVVTVQKTELKRFVGTISVETLERVKAAMLFALGFDD